MKTELYLPYTKFKINDKDGERILLEALIANGPAYKIVVHENEEWEKLQEEILIGDWIDIVTDNEAREIKEECKNFFLPVIEDIPYLVDNENRRIPTENIISNLNRALSYIIIANRKKAWIYGDDIIGDAKKDIKWFYENKESIPEDGFKRIEAFNVFLNAYQQDKHNCLSLINDPNISHDFFDILDISLVEELSEKGFQFGLLGYKYEMLERDVKDLITKILHNKTLPYLLNGMGFLSSICNYPDVGMLTSSLGIISHALRDVDLREYAPPMGKDNIFSLIKFTGSFEIGFFNMEYKFFKDF